VGGRGGGGYGMGEKLLAYMKSSWSSMNFVLKCMVMVIITWLDVSHGYDDHIKCRKLGSKF